MLDLKSVATDAATEIYMTTDGELRLQLDPKGLHELTGATWSRGGKTTALTLLDVHGDETLRMIWHELGIYGDLKKLKMQRPCDIF